MSASVSWILRARYFRWGVNSVASFVVNLGMTVFLHEFMGAEPATAYAVALFTVFLMNFVFFRYYVFVQPEPMPWRTQFATYAASAVGIRLLEYLTFLLVHMVGGIQYVIAIVMIQGVSFVAKYFFYGRLVFRGKTGA